MCVIDAGKIEGVKIPAPYERTVKVLLAPDTQDLVKDVSITMGIIAPHSRNDLHTHEGFELLYIVTGFGKAVLGENAYEIKHDSLIVAAPGVPHQQINESDDTMKMFAIWTPAVSGKEVLDRALIAAKGQAE
jgi:quercetin dioxygenase-like cupin family protein